MLYDTGASITCVSEKTFRTIPTDQRPPKLNMVKPNFQSAGGHQLQVRGLYNLPLKLLGKVVEHPVFVIKDLSEPAIIGIDFINKHGLTYSPKNQRFGWNDEAYWKLGVMRTSSKQIIPPRSTSAITVNTFSENHTKPAKNHPCLGVVHSPDLPGLGGGPALIKIDAIGQSIIEINNGTDQEISLDRNTFIGFIENIEDFEIDRFQVEKLCVISEHKTVLSKEKRQYLLDTAKIDAPGEEKQKYLDLVLEHHNVFSFGKHDLGRADILQHEIRLKNKDPIYVKQFRIPEAHTEHLIQQAKEWLKLGVIQPSRSAYNSPLFLVAKKDGGLRVVQDFRALNTNSYIDKYSMKDIQECISEIGRAGSHIFSTIDLTSGFWQMLLEPKSRAATSFTIPSFGQFEWVTSPMGLLGCPASFQRLVELVVRGLENVIVYIDDLLVHSKSHVEHRKQLASVFERLAKHGLKINLQKCTFGAKDVLYLGFRLTENGIKPGTDKLKTISQAKPPTNIHEVRQFLGLCNFFRNLVRNFAQVTAPLCALTRKDCLWKNGPLPDEALKSFQELQTILCSNPVVDFPRKGRHYCLITDAALGDDKNPGGLGAILTQLDENNEHRVIAYASRKLAKHEKNYTPFLLEMNACVWAMEHYDNYLRGQPFTLFTDHKPLEKLGKVHTRTLNRLQEAMNIYNFDICYKKGSEMPADYLSRHAIDAISWDSNELLQAQNHDPLISKIKNYILHRQIPSDNLAQTTVRHYALDCFVENEIVWRRLKRGGEAHKVVIFLPQALVNDVLTDAHDHKFSGHEGTFKTKERLLNCYYWPGMDKDIQQYIAGCHKCQIRKRNYHTPPSLLDNLPFCSEPNQRIHVDLFGPLKTSENGKKYILTITDAFTKYAELVAIPDKEALTVTSAIFSRWICRFGLPLEILSDCGKEFLNKMTEELYRLLEIKRSHTSGYHPQCNAQAEVGNKTIARYLASFVNSTTLDWEQCLPPLMLCYNTSFHRSIKNSPFVLTFGMEPRLPYFPTPDLRRKFYGESEAADIFNRFQFARKVALENNIETTEKSHDYFNQKAKPHGYQNGQLVLLEETQFLGKNTKLAPKYSGPHRVISQKGPVNIELLLANGRKIVVHVSRIKPYLLPFSKPGLNNDDDKNIANDQRPEFLLQRKPHSFSENVTDNVHVPHVHFPARPPSTPPVTPLEDAFVDLEIDDSHPPPPHPLKGEGGRLSIYVSMLMIFKTGEGMR